MNSGNTLSLSATPPDLPPQGGGGVGVAPGAALPYDVDAVDRPMHTGVTREPASTPAYFRAFLPFAALRYLFRGWAAGWEELLGQAKAFVAEEKISCKEGPVSPLKAAWWGGKPGFNAYLRQPHPKSDNLKIDLWLDTILGAGTLALTSTYAWRVSDDMKHLFAEAVAYETGNDPKNISFLDLKNSDNRIVQGTVHTFMKRSAERVASDFLFFGRWLGRASEATAAAAYIPFGTELGIGVKGGMLLGEVLNKKTTLFEDLVRLSDAKLNPTHGLGERITTSDIIDIYQKYTSEHDPKSFFRDTTARESTDAMDWRRSEPVFARIAQLMNESYKYKHSSNGHPPENFLLPKFLYLLGHDLISPYKPEESLAYVEVANRFGMEEVKKMQHALEGGTPLATVLERYDLVPAMQCAPGALPANTTPAALPLPSPETALPTSRITQVSQPGRVVAANAPFFQQAANL